MRFGYGRSPGALLALVLVMVASTLVAGADPSDEDLRAERERLRAEQARVAAQVDVTEADIDEITSALADLEANVRLQEAHLDEAERAVAAAETEVQDALAAQAATEAEVASLRETMATIAVDAYVSPPQADTLQVILDGDIGTAPERQVLLDLRTSDTADVLERLRAAQEDLAIQAETARLAQQRAEEGRAEVAERLATVEAARAEQEELAAQAQLRLDQMMHEMAELESGEAAIDAELTERERRREEERQAELRRQLAEAAARRGPVALPGGGSVDLVTVRGITVHASIGDQVAAMLNAAEADGLSLSGGGYRSSASQIALRRAHCGTSQYAVYQMSASRCSPPTARPGTSNHERGLAIDFNYCSTRSTACFQWLAANASRFGFRNLPSEPWHWSVNGQ